ncbi:chromatin-remodeling ATPase [Maudiozyma humilis]|uniref:Chromatin-remodeling ATPase INO80 n=1 Tax=Maudiozyma humilis TaxID=51915 RepID=A0AAV5RTK4_MAUHU|nr:chromatin-remodeling ATPase [Kazachstania humilis]
MSLTALLNDDQADPPVQPQSQLQSQQEETFVSGLNSAFTALQRRDSLEADYQDWKFLNFQQFELISEWNYQSKADWNTAPAGTDGPASSGFRFQHLYGAMDDARVEWDDYAKYRDARAAVISAKLGDVSHSAVQRRRRPAPMQSVTIATASPDASEESEEEGSEESEEDSAEDTLPPVQIDDETDADFDPAAPNATAKSAPATTAQESPAQLLLHGSRLRITRELVRLCNKNKAPKVKKRRFTNALIAEYNPAQNLLQVKITLKQFHSKKLKRHINEAKRVREKQHEKQRRIAELRDRMLLDGSDDSENGRASQFLKKRRLNGGGAAAEGALGDTDDYDSAAEGNSHAHIDRRTIPTHGLPTYGMKMSAKEARAIQRHYDNTYITVWKDLARKDSNKMVRMIQQMQTIKATNFKKTSSLCAREARKWQSRNFKQIKDFQTRARRGIREMSNFWKKSEREEREIKKKQEKVALEQAKREDDERESQRQAKKLNFLLTQTELYSHFIGRKIKTDEYEGNEAKDTSENDVDLENTDSSKKNDFREIDFDNENDDALRIKAAENASNVLAATRAKAKEFDNQANEHDEEDDDELNFQNPTSLGEITIEQPKLLACTLKEYQLKGLNWLANLYDQGINGILADEMGLGKTVQSISVLAHLAERYNIWGPFLVVTPASTLHNWVNEISKFVPSFKILPYWGNGNDRKILRKFWDRKNVRYGKDAPFHVMITSYQMVVSDVSYFQKMKWQYMILDEAQAIKSSQSSRWKNLLNFHSRNRLLLTGTPIQNNMQELWALLHFIMPSLFDSHDEFSEWFSKDIESHAESNTKLNQQQLRRLHMILKPFMLRRIKKNVQSELGDKIEIDVLCDLTQRQAKLYQVLKSQISGAYDAIENAAGNDEFKGDQNLINTVMQFRKVCNHPDLFERADIESPFSFVTFGKSSTISKHSAANGGTNTMSNSVNNSSANIAAIANENGSASTFGTIIASNYTDWVDMQYSTRNPITYNMPKLLYDEMILPNYKNSVADLRKLLHNTMSVLNATENRQFCDQLVRITGLGVDELKTIINNDIIHQAINLDNEKCSQYNNAFDKSLLLCGTTDKLTNLSKETTGGVLESLLNIPRDVYVEKYLNTLSRAYHPAASATPINIRVLGSSNFTTRLDQELFNPTISQALSDIPATTQYNMLVHKKIPLEEFPKTNMFPEPLNNSFSCNISMPSMDRFITESAKLKKLDELLVKLKEEGHRVLVYFQMTKMMDLMEEYLTYRQYSYIRLDGSSKLEDRRDLVHDWQTNPDIFVFLLSTRAGGLGINLTAADTVIFYDSDWNPTIDSQAMDRAHRLGQTKQVTVYRLLVKDTIEERMRDRAKQKEQVQQVVMEGKTQEHNVKTIEAEENIPA